MTDVGGDRQAAIERVKAKRDFRVHAAVFILANVLFLVGWLTGPVSYFWPIWPFIGWGLGLAYHGWCVYGAEKPISEDEIRREMKKAA
jgi:hypothetical protein